jgi:hypothetical protein
MEELGEAGDQPHRARDATAPDVAVQADRFKLYAEMSRIREFIVRVKGVLLLMRHLLLQWGRTGPAIGPAAQVSG